MNKVKNILVMSVVFLLSCENTSTKIIPEIKEDQQRGWLISDIIKEGDVESYNSFIFNYYNDIQCIPLSIYMIEQYNYGPACYQLYSYFSNFFEENSLSMDSVTKEYMLYYLRKGVELEDTNCIWVMSRLYLSGKYVEKDTVLAKKNLMRIFIKDDVDSFIWPYLNKHILLEPCPVVINNTNKQE